MFAYIHAYINEKWKNEKWKKHINAHVKEKLKKIIIP